MRFFKDLSASALVAGFVTVLVGLTSSIAIVFQAAQNFGATPAQVSSWVWSIGIGVGLCCWLPSLWWRKPVVMAWSTPGAAVLATAGATGAFTMNEAIGAFVLSAVLIILVGVTGWFERLMNRIPVAIASALLAGVLTRFGLDAFAAAQTNTWLVVTMLLAYLVGRRWLPRYAVMATLAAGIVVALAQHQINWSAVQPGLTFPVFTMPAFSLQAAISLALPLFVVTMASQNLPGVAVIRGTGYDLPISKLISITGLATLVLAPFGGYAINLAAITAAICMGPESHPDKARRYTAAVVCGVIYVLIGCFGVVIAGLLTAFPHELVVAIAGIALLGTIGNGLYMAMQSEQYREAALITFLVAVSGVAIAGIGSAFWGVVAGSLALFVQHYGKRPTP